MCNKEEPNFSCYLIFFPPAKNITASSVALQNLYIRFLFSSNNFSIHITSASACMGNTVPILAGFMACLLVFVHVVQVCATKQGVSSYPGKWQLL